jgi:hypothetical protein
MLDMLHLGFSVMTTKHSFFWDEMPCIPVEAGVFTGETYRPQLQGEV